MPAFVLFLAASLVLLAPSRTRADVLLDRPLAPPVEAAQIRVPVAEALLQVGQGTAIAATSFVLSTATFLVLLDAAPGSLDLPLALGVGVLATPLLTSEVSRRLWGAQPQPSLLRVYLWSAGVRALFDAIGFWAAGTSNDPLPIFELMAWSMLGTCVASVVEAVVARPARPSPTRMPFEIALALGALGLPVSNAPPQVGADAMAAIGVRRDGIGALLLRMHVAGIMPKASTGRLRGGFFADAALQYRTPLSFESAARPFAGAWLGGAFDQVNGGGGHLAALGGAELGVALPLSPTVALTMSTQVTALGGSSADVFAGVALGLQGRGAD